MVLLRAPQLESSRSALSEAPQTGGLVLHDAEKNLREIPRHLLEQALFNVLSQDPLLRVQVGVYYQEQIQMQESRQVRELRAAAQGDDDYIQFSF